MSAEDEGRTPDDNTEAEFRELLRGMNSRELTGLLAEVTAAGRDPREAQRSGRRPRRDDHVTLRARADIVDANPPLWRRLDLSSHLPLDELHSILQVAFDWNDSHLHRFALGGSVYDVASEKFLCPFDVEDGDEDGIAESEVRLDELLVEPGDVLTYVYDFGDDWEVLIVLETVLDRLADAPSAVATGGRRASPPDDFGGIYTYDEAVRDGTDREPDQIDLDALNDALARGAAYSRIVAVLPVELRLVLAGCRGTVVHDTLLELVLEAGLETPAVPTEAVAAETTERYRWLLQRIGSSGMKLTAAGYLPPAVVVAVYEALGLEDEWFGKGNREDLTIPVLSLRTSAVSLGLLRKSRGLLLQTKAGSAGAADPVALWWHVTRRFPLEPAGSVDRIVALIRILGLAAGRDVSARRFRAFAADVLTAIGWTTTSGRLTADSMYGFDLESDDVLSHCGAFDRSAGYARGVPSSQGRVLARAVLQHLASTA